MKPYLCGPINGCTDAECQDWRAAWQSFYPRAIDPMRRDYRGREAESYREIVELDKLDIRQCDALIVNYVKPSVGTSMEIFYAWQIGKPIVLICAPSESLSPWLRYHCTRIVHTVKDALAFMESLRCAKVSPP